MQVHGEIPARLHKLATGSGRASSKEKLGEEKVTRKRSGPEIRFEIREHHQPRAYRVIVRLNGDWKDQAMARARPKGRRRGVQRYPKFPIALHRRQGQANADEREGGGRNRELSGQHVL